MEKAKVVEHRSYFAEKNWKLEIIKMTINFDNEKCINFGHYGA